MDVESWRRTSPLCLPSTPDKHAALLFDINLPPPSRVCKRLAVKGLLRGQKNPEVSDPASPIRRGAALQPRPAPPRSEGKLPQRASRTPLPPCKKWEINHPPALRPALPERAASSEKLTALEDNGRKLRFQSWGDGLDLSGDMKRQSRDRPPALPKQQREAQGDRARVTSDVTLGWGLLCVSHTHLTMALTTQILHSIS